MGEVEGVFSANYLSKATLRSMDNLYGLCARGGYVVRPNSNQRAILFMKLSIHKWHFLSADCVPFPEASYTGQKRARNLIEPMEITSTNQVNEEQS